MVNMTRAAANSADMESVSGAMGKLREDIFSFVDLLKKHIPAFRHCHLIQTAVQLGCRESRRILGLHTLTGDELLNGVHFEDTIACSAHPVDIHKAADTSQELIFLKEPGYIPYRSLITKNYDNLIAAGRCISADRRAFASLRVQAPSMATGQAAGAAAALGSIGKVKLQDLSIVQLQELLRKQNAII
jgi:hypothetical protein